MASAFAGIVNQLGYTRRMMRPGCLRVIVPGLPYTSFDPYGYPQPWSMVNILDSTQISAVHTYPRDDVGSLFDLHHLFEKALTFIVASKADFYEPLYDKSIVKSPLIVDNTVSNIGKTTLVINSVMKLENTKLAELKQLQIFMDEKTRRPVPVPDWWKEKYGDMIGSAQPLVFPNIVKPSSDFVTKVPIGSVPYSDTDSYFHLNFSNYVKYCINGLQTGKNEELEPIATRKPALVKSVFCRYRQETNFGDNLSVDFWKHQSQANSWCVDLTRDNSSVYQCLLEFYATKQKSSL